jgi:very-short-patch-repair endonuclease
MSHPELFDGARRGRARDKWSVLIESQIEQHGLPYPVPEYSFAVLIGRKWRFDYAFVQQKIALEVDGGSFGRVIRGADGKFYRLGGYHATGRGLEIDHQKFNAAARLGWMVVRVTTTMIRDGKAITELLDAFKARRTNGERTAAGRTTQ